MFKPPDALGLVQTHSHFKKVAIAGTEFCNGFHSLGFGDKALKISALHTYEDPLLINTTFSRSHLVGQ